MRATGFSLIESMVAMAVLMVGSLGLLSLHGMGVRMNGDARVMTRATEIAQDLVNQIQTWNYATETAAGGRLENLNKGNDADYADAAFAFQAKDSVTTSDYDHEEADLANGTWSGIQAATVQELHFTRYWNVAAVDIDENGALLGVRVAVIVRWGENGRWRRIVLLTYLPDPRVT